MVQSLVENGADLEVQDADFKTAIYDLVDSLVEKLKDLEQIEPRPEDLTPQNGARHSGYSVSGHQGEENH